MFCDTYNFFQLDCRSRFSLSIRLLICFIVDNPRGLKSNTAVMDGIEKANEGKTVRQLHVVLSESSRLLLSCGLEEKGIFLFFSIFLFFLIRIFI